MTTTALPPKARRARPRITRQERRSRQRRLDKRHRVEIRLGALERERSSWDGHWRDISKRLLPRHSRFFETDRNKGDKRHNNIIDHSATTALQILTSGLHAGATSPARPWFRLQTSDSELNKMPSVRRWLDDVRDMILRVFAKSNAYEVLPHLYSEIGAFGTAACIVTEDYENVLHFTPMTVGEYCLAQDWKGNVNTLYRKFQRTVAEVVDEFGYENCSVSVQQQYDQESYDNWVTIIHAIEPNEHYNAESPFAVHKAWRSCYVEEGAEPDTYLRESGFDRFPVLAPRWKVIGQDIYGESPGMVALGSINQLQFQQLRRGQVVDHQTNPALVAPESLRNRESDFLPGGVTFDDTAATNNAGVRAAFEVKADLNAIRDDIFDTRSLIREPFFADLFLMMHLGQDNPQKTAREVAELHGEKLLMLGPVMQQLERDLHRPMVQHAYDVLERNGVLPEVPEEIAGRDIQPEFISMLAQAQKAVQLAPINQWVADMLALAQGGKPEVLDKLNVDAYADTTADLTGVPPHLLNDDDVVAQIREARAQQQAAAAQLEATAQGASALKDMGAAGIEPTAAFSSLGAAPQQEFAA
ncbi:MAG: phage head-tail adapter protein [Planctomycetes bacterium]|nr:phage head-tail adapter protein [Planctomycetota bacterium]